MTGFIGHAVESVTANCADRGLSNTGRITLLESRSGDVTARYKGEDGREIFLHSSVDPVREAKRFADAVDIANNSHLIILGAGLGYHLNELAQRLEQDNSEVTVIVIEADPDLANWAGQKVDSDRISIVAGLDPSSIPRNIADRIDVTVFTGMSVVYHNPSIKANRTYYERVQQQLAGALNNTLLATNTVLHYSRAWHCNHILNLPHVVANPGISGLMSRFNNVPAIIVGAGPSLDKNINQLKQAKGKAVIIACDTALKSLLAADVTPDLVMAIDGTDLNYRSFSGVTRDDIVLVCEPMANYRILHDWKGPIVVCSFGSPIGRWVDKFLGDKGELRTGGSVSTSAFHLAYKLGCNPLVFMGQDLSYPEGRTYARGTFYDVEDRKLDFKDSDLVEVPGIDGGTVVTSRFMYGFLNWFDESIKYLKSLTPDLQVIDATEGGAYIAGSELQCLSDVIAEFCTGEVDVASCVNELFAKYARGDVDGLIRELQECSVQAKKLERSARQGVRVIRWLRNGKVSWSQCLDKLAEIDRKLIINADTTELVEAFVQRPLFALIRKLNTGQDVDIVQENERVYAEVAESAHLLAGLLWHVVPMIRKKMRGEEVSLCGNS